MFNVYRSFSRGVPVFWLFGFLLLGGSLACGRGGAPPPKQAPASEEPRVELGARVYQQNCLACHQADGAGVPSLYPPLQRTSWVRGDEGRLIRLLLNGMRGPINVKGVTYSQVMTPHDFLSDRHLAAVLTYVRSHFGNDAGPVTAEQVRAVRSNNEREGFWTARELRERRGVPD